MTDATAFDDAKATPYVTEAVRAALEEIDRLPVEFRRKAVAMIAANYDVQIKTPTATGRSYGYRHSRKRSY